MTKREKAAERLLSKPSDFSWAELAPLMESFGYELKKTGGSGRKFVHTQTKATLFMHEPHPGKILKAYQVREAIRFLKQEGHLK
jgi:predicted RNA binding protein YcfA (HicA-like mRNA interferase family)